VLCRELLGEDLAIESTPTWWCGDPLSRQHVLANLDSMIVKPTFPNARFEPCFPSELPIERREALVESIKARPRDYTAQSAIQLSTAPVMQGQQLHARTMVLRTYLAADSSDSFMVMPGGLTRVAAGPGERVVSMQRGGGSKDTWVLASGPVSNLSLLTDGGAVQISRGGGDLPSRAADNLYWLGRYAERAEATTRLLRGIVIRLAERTGVEEAPELPSLMRSLLTGPETAEQLADVPNITVFAAACDLGRQTSLVSVLRNLRRVAGVVRDLISIDMWRMLNGLSEFPVDTAATLSEEGPTPADLLELLNRTIVPLAAFGGLAVESMTRGPGWRFLDMGRKMERSMQTASLLKSTLVRPVGQESPVLEAVLEIADSGMTYRRRYLGNLRADAVLDLLVLDESNPRSLVSQLIAIEDDVNHLPRNRSIGRAPEQRLALTALNDVRLAEAERLAAIHNGLRPGLLELIDGIGTVLPRLSDTITQQFLSLLQTSRHLAPSSNLNP
jgi:uncharacterized alpha-E superfamily protein